MREFFEKLLKIDRRWIFLMVGAALMIPILKPLNLPGLKASTPVQNLYDYIEGLPEGSKVLISFDFDPASKPELEPMGAAILRHCLRKKLKVVAMTLWVTGSSLAQRVIEREAKAAGAVYGEDYVYLGWKPGNVAVITGMREDIHVVFPKDSMQTDLSKIPMMQEIRRLRDFDLAFSFAAGSPGLDTWIAYGTDKEKIKMGGGSTAVNVPSMAVFVQSGQLVGFIGALRGAAEYELLMNFSGSATRGMDGITVGSYLLAALIILANVGYLLTRKPKGVS